MRVRLHDAAKDDLAKGYRFYERQEEGLGDRFLDHMDLVIDKLQHTAGTHSVRYPPYFQTYSHVFPFTIYYLIEDGEVRIDGVIDQRRDPEWIEGQLETRSEMN
jgi:hypothetical protein